MRIGPTATKTGGRAARASGIAQVAPHLNNGRLANGESGDDRLARGRARVVPQAARIRPRGRRVAPMPTPRRHATPRHLTLPLPLLPTHTLPHPPVNALCHQLRSYTDSVVSSCARLVSVRRRTLWSLVGTVTWKALLRKMTYNKFSKIL